MLPLNYEMELRYQNNFISKKRSHTIFLFVSDFSQISPKKIIFFTIFPIKFILVLKIFLAVILFVLCLTLEGKYIESY